MNPTGDGEITEVEEERYPQFDVGCDLSDHYYLNRKSHWYSNPKPDVHRRITKEWKILRENLPESIFVRVYEQRIDLLRAVIVGAAGTPYHDGLFVFDIAFPANYPAQPPEVYYRSFGLRLNPNLYSNGRVCLSLLNTWKGGREEKWDPSQSTVLQVLVSIQGLVLTEEPFYNEPGVGAPSGSGPSEKPSSLYSQTVFALSCKTMLYLLRNPTKNFEPFIARHFRHRARFILEACDAYINGRVAIGYYRGDGPSSSSSSSSRNVTVSVSSTFKSSMRKLLPDLVRAFVRIEAPVRDIVEQMKRVKEKRPLPVQPAPPAPLKKQQGVAVKAITILKNIFGRKEKESSGSGSSVVVSTESRKS